MTPTIVAGAPVRRTVRPTTPESPLKRLCHRSWPITATRTAGNREAILEFEDEDGRLLSVIASIPVTGINESFTLTAGPNSYWPSSP